MKYRIKTTNRFDKQLKRCEKRGYDMHLIFNAMRLLAQNGSLPKEYLPHPLKGDRKGQWECHILLVVAKEPPAYKVTDIC